MSEKNYLPKDIKSYFPKELYALNEKEFRKEVTKIVSVANKRIERLEKSNLKDSPAYQKLLNDGGVRFSVKGKTHNQLQSEVARLKKFMESETSTVRGLNNTLKNMAKVTGVKYRNLRDLQSKAKNFFTLANKVEQYLRTVNDIASAIGYQKIWTAINQYVQKNKIDLANAEGNIEGLTKTVSELLAGYDRGKIVTEEQHKKIVESGVQNMVDDIAKEIEKKWWFIE